MALIELLIDESDKSELEVDRVGLVDEPAIGVNWFAFKDDAMACKFEKVDNAERIIVGAAMIPDMPIKRVNDDGSTYEVMFSKDTVKIAALKFFRKNFQRNANIQHDPNQPVNGLTFFLSFIRDTDKGMIGLEGDYPNGTWFLGAKVEDDATWQKVESGEIRGFSVEGMFKYKKQQLTPAEAFAKINEILNGISFE